MRAKSAEHPKKENLGAKRKVAHKLIDSLDGTELWAVLTYLEFIKNRARIIEDYLDHKDAQEAIREAEEKGYIPWETIKREMGL
ncbi:MAG: hypothetical protein IT462_10485 [Planctomycetes bacterium]|nr:hypothetical protein [Planctomycetota bacterium]